MIRSSPEPHSRELLSRQPLDDRFQTLLPTGAASRPYPDHAQRYRDVVAQDDEVGSPAFPKTLEKQLYRVSAEIHVSQRFRQCHPLRGQRYFGYLGLQLPAELTAAGSLHKPVNEHEPEIVPGVFIFPARVAEPNNQLHTTDAKAITPGPRAQQTIERESLSEKGGLPRPR